MLYNGSAEDVELVEKIKNKVAGIGMIGVGHVGLPPALVFAKAGSNMLGLDVQQERVDGVNKGQSYYMTEAVLSVTESSLRPE
jgi:UDP-N-acetyl-D-mannosaminuronate dehydrogenase